MFEREQTLYRFMLGYAQMLTKDIEETEMGVQPTPGANCPNWTLGHMTIASEMASRMMGREPTCPRQWFVLFGRGSQPEDTNGRYPQKAELLAGLGAAHVNVCAGIAASSPAKFEEPNPMEELKMVLPTLGDLLGHVMTTHEAMHLGQLSAWRKAMGKPRVF